MRIPFPNPRHEAKDVARYTKVFGVRLDHGLAREFAGPVKAGLEGRIAFGRRKDVRLTVHCRAAREDNASNFIGTHRLQHVPRGYGILFKVNSCQLCAAADVGIRLQMEHKVAICHFVLQPFAVEDVRADYSDLAVREVAPDELLLTGAEVVVDCHLGAILSEPIDDVASDKS